MKRVIFNALLLLTLCGLLPAGPLGAQSVGAEDMFNMMRGMSSMMKLWNEFSSGSEWDSLGGYDDPLSSYDDLSGWDAPYSSRRYGRRGRGLDGTWIGSGGDRLRIRGRRFSLCPGRVSRACSGTLRIYGDRFIAYSPLSRATTQYQFRKRGDILLLRDVYGNYLLFRRLRR